MKSLHWRTVLRVAWNETSRAALISLLATNAIPLVGVLTGRWSLFSVMLLYWMENGVVGAYNAAKIVMAQGGTGAGSAGLLGRLPLAVFFWFHYGIFWFVHGVFVVVLFGGAAAGRGLFGAGLGGLGPFNALALARADAELPGGLWGTVGLLAVSHGISFVNNFIGRNEYQRISPQEQMMQPYQRVILLHVTVLAGGFIVMLLGQPLLALVLLVLLKTGVDLRAHIQEHRRT
jgi:hypothetical protein